MSDTKRPYESSGDMRVEDVPEVGLMLCAECDSEAWRFTDPVTREAMIRVLHDEECPVYLARLVHVERPTKMHGGRTYCSCGSPWPCDKSAP